MSDTLTKLEHIVEALDAKKSAEEILELFEHGVTVLFELAQQIQRKADSLRDGKDGQDGQDGRDGKDGRPGQDGVNGRDGIDGRDGKNGRDGRDGKDGSPDTADDIRNKLELLPEGEKLNIDAIEHLREELDDLRRKRATMTGGGGGAMPGRYILPHDLSSSLDGATKTFSLPAFNRIVLVLSSSTPVPLRKDVDWTEDANNMQITFTSNVDETTVLAPPQTLLILYAQG